MCVRDFWNLWLFTVFYRWKEFTNKNTGQLNRSHNFKPMDLKGYYASLGLKPDCTDQDIKSAYRKQALVHHPDRGGTEEAFKTIQEAYETLSDKEKREMYDSGIDPRPRDVHAEKRQYVTIANVEIGADQFVEIDTDHERTCVVDVNILCAECKGSSVCGKCKGRGSVIDVHPQHPTIYITRPCPPVEHNKIRCKTCNNQGKVGTRESHRVTIPFGHDVSKPVLVIPNRGEQITPSSRCDLAVYVKITLDGVQTRHKTWIDFPNIVMVANVPLLEALTGYRCDFTLGNKTETIAFDKIVHPSYRYICRGKGFCIKEKQRFGSLIIVPNIVWPEEFTLEQKQLIDTAKTVARPKENKTSATKYTMPEDGRAINHNVLKPELFDTGHERLDLSGIGNYAGGHQAANHQEQQGCRVQ